MVQPDTTSAALGSPISRRRFMSAAAALGLGAPVAIGLLTACGGETPAEPSEPSGAATSTSAASGSGGASSGGSATPGNESGSSGEAPAGDTDTIVVVDGTEPESLSPTQGTGPFQHPMAAMYEGLVEFNQAAELTPRLATSWEVSSDGTIWTFNLREGVKFHDGTDFTSEAVKVTFEHLLDPDVAANRRSSYTLIQEIDTSEDYVVRFVTDPPNPDFPALMADGSARIISPAALEKYGADFGRNPVGTGPYQFVEWIPNDHVTLVRFEDYWGEKPEIKNFIYRPIPEVSTRVVVLRTGEADIVFNLPPDAVEELESLNDVTIESTPSLTVHMMEPRVKLPPLNDARVRRALNMAIDKDAIIEHIMRGYARPLLTPGIPGLWGTVEFDPIPFDPEQARALLAEAGYPDGFDVNITYTSGRWAGDDQVVEAVQGFWANIGVRATVNKVDNATFVAALRKDPLEMPGEIIMPIRSSFFLDYHLYRMYHTTATHEDAAQRSGYSNPAADELLDAQRLMFDEEERAKAFAEAQRLIWEDQPMIYLFHRVNIWGRRNNLTGFEIHPGNHMIPGKLRKTS